MLQSIKKVSVTLPFPSINVELIIVNGIINAKNPDKESRKKRIKLFEYFIR
jgi:hypothetical protein